MLQVRGDANIRHARFRSPASLAGLRPVQFREAFGRPVSDVPPPDDHPPVLTQLPAGAIAHAPIITMIARARRERDVFMPSCTDSSKRNDIECDNAQPVPLARTLTVGVCVGSSANGGGVMRR